MQKAFTLIELLVVVLIIGILSAVALPQYTKAVERARASEGIILTRAILDAQKRYQMANGHYTQDLNDLDIQIPGSAGEATGHALSVQSAKYFTCSAASTGSAVGYIAFCRRQGNLYFIFATTNFPELYCGGDTGSGYEKWCTMITGHTAEEGFKI